MFSLIQPVLSKTQLPYKPSQSFLSRPPPTRTLPVHSYLFIIELGY